MNKNRNQSLKHFSIVQAIFEFITAITVLVLYIIAVIRIGALVLVEFKPEWAENYFHDKFIPYLDIQDQRIERPSKRAAAALALASNQKYIDAKERLEKINQLDIDNLTVSSVSECQNNHHFQPLNLKERHFRFIRLDNVIICNVNLIDAELGYANVKNSQFSGEFNDSQWQWASLEETKLQASSNFDSSNFNNARLSNVVANNISFVQADFSDAEIYDSQLSASSLFGAILKDSIFNRTHMHSVNFGQADFTDVKFIGINVYDANLNQADNLTNNQLFTTSNIVSCIKDGKRIENTPQQSPVDFATAQCQINKSQALIAKVDDKQLNGKDTTPPDISETDNTKSGTAAALFTSDNDKTATVNSLIDIAAKERATSIDLSGMGLKQLPAKLLSLKHLKEVRLHNNQLDHNQLAQLAASLPNLTFINFERNKLEILPLEVTQLEQLAALGVGGNKLSSLPPELFKLTQLTNLSLGGNQFKTIPEVIFKLTKLKELYLSNNQITTLPNTINQLKNLETLWLVSNQLNQLPAALIDLPIITLQVTGNKLTSPPQAIADKGFDAIKQWFADNP